MINKKLRINVFFSTLLIFGIGALIHFAYDLFNNNFIIGLIAPVNESVFEHLKLALYPTMLWWFFFYIFKKDKYLIKKNNWFWGAFNSLITSIVTIISIHYFIRFGLGIESVISDIIILYIAIFISQFYGLYSYNDGDDASFNLTVILFIMLFASLILFTLFPPKVPFFEDEETKTYGIYKLVK